MTALEQRATVSLKLRDSDGDDSNDVVLATTYVPSGSPDERFPALLDLPATGTGSLQVGMDVYVTQTVCDRESTTIPVPSTNQITIEAAGTLPTPTIDDGEFVQPRFVDNPGGSKDGHTFLTLTDQGRVPGADLLLFVDQQPVPDTEIISVPDSTQVYFFDTTVPSSLNPTMGKSLTVRQRLCGGTPRESVSPIASAAVSVSPDPLIPDTSGSEPPLACSDVKTPRIRNADIGVSVLEIVDFRGGARLQVFAGPGGGVEELADGTGPFLTLKRQLVAGERVVLYQTFPECPSPSSASFVEVNCHEPLERPLISVTRVRTNQHSSQRYASNLPVTLPIPDPFDPNSSPTSSQHEGIIYYPSTGKGDPAEPFLEAPSSAPYPLAVLIHQQIGRVTNAEQDVALCAPTNGIQTDIEAFLGYRVLAERLARRGFVVVVPDLRTQYCGPRSLPWVENDTTSVEHVIELVKRIFREADDTSTVIGSIVGTSVDTANIMLLGHGFGGVLARELTEECPGTGCPDASIESIVLLDSDAYFDDINGNPDEFGRPQTRTDETEVWIPTLSFAALNSLRPSGERNAAFRTFNESVFDPNDREALSVMISFDNVFTSDFNDSVPSDQGLFGVADPAGRTSATASRMRSVTADFVSLFAQLVHQSKRAYDSSAPERAARNRLEDLDLLFGWDLLQNFFPYEQRHFSYRRGEPKPFELVDSSDGVLGLNNLGGAREFDNAPVALVNGPSTLDSPFRAPLLGYTSSGFELFINELGQVPDENAPPGLPSFRDRVIEVESEVTFRLAPAAASVPDIEDFEVSLERQMPSFDIVPRPNTVGHSYEAELPGGGPTESRRIFTTVRLPGRCLGASEGSPQPAVDFTLRYVGGAADVWFDDLIYDQEVE